MMRFFGEGAGIVYDIAGRKSAERDVEVIEARVRKLQSDALHAELIGNDMSGCAVGALTASHPELLALLIPDTIASALKDHLGREFLHRVELGLRAQLPEGAGEDRLLSFAFRMAEARQQRLAIEHDGGVGRKHEIGKLWDRIDEFDRCSFAAELVVKRVPLSICRPPQIVPGARPALRIHPRIDAIADGEILRAAHQKARPRLRVYRVAPHPPPVSRMSR